jgi:BirA family biotin operon repressor/biotin-[acetyl-CoA-carboxylase] ligase
MSRQIIGEHVISLLNVPSTNDYARELLEESKPENGTVIIAGEQAKGRGYGSNTWISQSGKNLTFSILLFPSFLEASSQFLLSKAISLGIADYLCNYLDDVTIKWPNDIYVDNYKIGGILIENDLVGSQMRNAIVGVGLNINQSSFPADLPNPVSLMQVMECTFSLKKEFRKLARHMDRRYKMLTKKNMDRIHRDYHNNLYRLNEYHEFIKDDEKFRARIIGVSDYGQLVLESEHGKTMEFNFKEVQFVL